MVRKSLNLNTGRQTRATVSACAVQHGHWGEFLEVGLRWQGNIETVGITVPRADIFSKVKIQASSRAFVRPVGRPKMVAMISKIFAENNCDIRKVDIFHNSNIPVGAGGGSSTADSTAAALAACQAVGIRMSACDVQRRVFELEKASDPLVLLRPEKTLIYGTRSNQTIMTIHRPLPAMKLIGFRWSGRQQVHTDSLPDRKQSNKRQMQWYCEALRRAIKGIMTNSVELFGQAATLSARLNQERYEIPKFDTLRSIVNRFGSVGLAISHSGTAMTAMFPRNISNFQRRVDILKFELGRLGCVDIAPFELFNLER